MDRPITQVGNKLVYIILILSLINWIPTLSILLVHMPLLIKLVGILILVSYFITPIAAVIYTIVAIVLMISKKTSVLLGCFMIITNLAYLIWGYKYLEAILYVT